jgi:hypothetical protein
MTAPTTYKYIVKCVGAGFGSWEYMQEATSPDHARTTAESTGARVLKVTPYLSHVQGHTNRFTAIPPNT